jgi:molecular chaperone GrpE
MEDKAMQNKDRENTVETADFSINADENAAGTTHLNEPLENEGEVEKLQEELKEQKDKYLRLYAEFDNYRRRTAKEMIDLRQTAGKEIIISLLDVLDDCDRAEKQLQQSADVSEIKDGIQLVFNKLRKALQSKGLRSVESINENFDVEKHEAVTEIPAPAPSMKGKVVDEIQKAYYLNDKIIRFAKVVVGK